MAHIYRFFAQKQDSEVWLIDSGEYNHIANVLRLSKGDKVEFCDGCGNWGVGVFSQISKSLLVSML